MTTGFPKQEEHCPFCMKTHPVEKFNYTGKKNTREVGFYCERTDQYFSVLDSKLSLGRKQRNNV